jgi:hypothetical protein
MYVGDGDEHSQDDDHDDQDYNDDYDISIPMYRCLYAIGRQESKTSRS